MIEKHLTQLFTELGLTPPPPFEKDGLVKITLFSFPMEVLKLESGAHISAPLAPLPTNEREEFLLKVMKANYLGQGTGGATLGLREDESFLTLSLSLPYEMNYRAFKDAIEDFVNYVEYWKTETARQDAQEDK